MSDASVKVETATKVIVLLSLFSFLCLLRFGDIHGQDEISHYMQLSRLLHRDWYTYPETLMTFSPHLYPLCQWGVGELLGQVNSFTLRLTNLVFWLGLLGCVWTVCRGGKPLVALVACSLMPLSVACTTIVEIDQTLLPLCVFVLVWSVESYVDGGCRWRSGIFVLLAYWLALWCRPTTPLVLFPLFAAYCWLRCGWRGSVALACWLSGGFALFFGSWWLYGTLTGVDWLAVFTYLNRSFGEVTVGSRSSGLGRLCQSFAYMVFWGMTPYYLLLGGYAALRCAKNVHALKWRLDESCLFLLAGIWLLGGYCIAGGALFGFPKYQSCGYPLVIVGIVLHGVRHWGWGNMRWGGWRMVFCCIGAALVFGVVAGDPLWTLRVGVRELQVTGGSVMGVVASCGFRVVLAHVLVCGAGYVAWRRYGAPWTVVLLWLGICGNLGFLGLQTFSNYNRGYMYGDSGDTRGVAAYVLEHGGDAGKSLLPVEVLDVLRRDDLIARGPFLLSEQSEVRRRIMEENPEVVAISFLVYPAGSVRAFLEDDELGTYLGSRYTALRIGRYHVWHCKAGTE